MRSRDAERMGRFGRSYRTGLAGNADGRDFRQLWVGDTISQFSTQVGVIALPPAPSDRVLVRLFGAPLVIPVDAVSFLGAVVFILRIRNRKEPSPKEGRRRLTVEIGAGCRSSNVAQVSFRQRLGPAPAARPENASIRFIVWGSIPVGAFLGAVIGRALRRSHRAVVAVGGQAVAVLPVVPAPAAARPAANPRPAQWPAATTPRLTRGSSPSPSPPAPAAASPPPRRPPARCHPAARRPDIRDRTATHGAGHAARGAIR